MTAEGERWGKYVLGDKIGEGGMGQVFRARQVGAATFAKQVCVKRMFPHLCADPDMVALFLDEATTGSNLHHDNIVAILDLGEHNGQYFIAMELVDGPNLAQLEAQVRAADERFPIDAAMFIAAKLLAALGAAHNAKDGDHNPLHIIHRDISPNNVLVGYDARVKLTDFGVARAASNTHVTEARGIRGRHGYMPLEQSSGRELDARVDLYALGVTLFELLTGKRPFGGEKPGDSRESIFAAQVMNERPALVDLRPDAPAVLIDLIESMLSQKPEGRPRDAATALATLKSMPELATGEDTLKSLMARLYSSSRGDRRSSLAPRALDSADTPQGNAPDTEPSAPPPAALRAEARPRLALVADTDPVITSPPIAGVASTLPRATAMRTGIGPRILGAAGGVGLAVIAAVALWAPLRGRRGAIATPTSAPAVMRAMASGEAPRPVSETAVIPHAPITPDPPANTAPTAPTARDVHEHRTRPAATRSEATANARVEAPAVAPAQPPPAQPASAPAPAPAPAPTPPPASAPAHTEPPAPAAHASTAPETGTLRVVALPWGDVTIDGHAYGRATVIARVPAGTHTVHVQGGVDGTQTVTVGAGGNASVLFR